MDMKSVMLWSGREHSERRKTSRVARRYKMTLVNTFDAHKISPKRKMKQAEEKLDYTPMSGNVFF